MIKRKQKYPRYKHQELGTPKYPRYTEKTNRQTTGAIPGTPKEQTDKQHDPGTPKYPRYKQQEPGTPKEQTDNRNTQDKNNRNNARYTERANRQRKLKTCRFGKTTNTDVIKMGTAGELG